MLKHIFRLISCCLILMFLNLSLKAQTQDQQKQLDQFLEQLFRNQQFNGTVLYAVDGQVLYHKSIGWADPDKKRKISEQTSFRLASVSKQFVALGVVLLEEQGKLDYDDPLSKHLPELKYPGVTIRHLLHHISGLPDYMDLFVEKWEPNTSFENRSTVTNKDVVDQLAKYQPPIDFQPGERYEYSNTGYALLGEVVARVSGQSIQDFFQQYIFEPLGMSNSRAFSTDSRFQLTDRAYGFNFSPTGNSFSANDWSFLNGIVGDGGIYCSALDLLKWDQALYTDKLVSLASIQRAFTPGRLNDGTSISYGFGWEVTRNPDYNRKIVSHSGSWVGFRTYIRRDIGPKTVLIILTNHDSEYLGEVLSGVDAILKGQPFDQPKQLASLEFAEVFNNKGLDEAISYYRQLYQEQGDQYDFKESALNDLGYYFFMEKEDLNAAAAIFALNAEVYPEHANPYDSWGEVLLAQKDTTDAIAKYSKSLSLNPGNNNARSILEELGVDVSTLVKEVKVNITDLKEFEGIYALSPDFKITVSRKGKRLFIQATGQPQFEVFPESKNRFYLKVVQAAVSFQKDETGKVHQLTLHQGGVDQIGKKE